MQVSICIANYNCGEFIKESIESVLMQDYNNWELIIIDDGSTDDSQTIIKSFLPNPRITFLSHSKNLGVGTTKRNCIDASQGEIIGFLDADDQLTQKALSIMVKEHEINLETSLIFSDFNVFDASMNFLYPNIYKEPEDSLFLMKGLTVNHFSTFKRTSYLKTSGINQNYKRSVDRDLYLKLEEAGAIKHLPQPLYKYRYRTDSTSNATNAYRAEYWAWKARFDACERRGLNTEDIFNEIMQERDQFFFRNLVSKTSIEYRIGSLLLWLPRYLKRIIR